MTAPLTPRQGGQRQEQQILVRWLPAIGQVSDASTEVTLYTCPVQRMARGRVMVCNRGAAPTVFHIRLKDQAADDDKQYIAEDFAIAANEAYTTDELFLDTGWFIEVHSDTSTVSFTFNGYTEPRESNG